MHVLRSRGAGCFLPLQFSAAPRVHSDAARRFDRHEASRRALEAKGVKTVDCRRAGFSAAETTTQLRHFCENWRQPFQKDYTQSSVTRAFEQLLALRADLEEALVRVRFGGASAPAPALAQKGGAAAKKSDSGANSAELKASVAPPLVAASASPAANKSASPSPSQTAASTPSAAPSRRSRLALRLPRKVPRSSLAGVKRRLCRSKPRKCWRRSGSS